MQQSSGGERQPGAQRAHRAGLDADVIVHAAAELADADGFEQLNVVQLAERLGVRPPSLYKHVANFEEIRRRLAIFGMRELVATLTRAAVGKSGREAVFAVAEAYRRFAQERPGLYAALQHAPDPDDPRNQEQRVAAEDVLAVLHAVLAPYALSDEDEIHAIRMLRSLTHGFVTLEAAGAFGIPIALDASFRFALDLFIRGLRPKDTSREGVGA